MKNYIKRIATYIEMGWDAARMNREAFAANRIDYETYIAAAAIIVASYNG